MYVLTLQVLTFLKYALSLGIFQTFQTKVINVM